ncbi:MAG: ATP-binding protein [Candidatus Omnitrophota bacterium]
MVKFPVGTPVMGKDLIGRRDELRQLEDLLVSGQSVILTSPRRYGKTSVCLELLSRLKNKKYFVVYLDIFLILSKRRFAEEIVNKTLENKQVRNFTYQLKERFTELFRKIEVKQVIKDFEFVLSFKDEKIDEWVLLKSALEFPEEFAKKYKRRMIVIIDEFGDLAKLNGVELFKYMRAIFQRQSSCSYLFTGSHESIMKKLFFDKRQPFFRFGIMMKLDVLPKKETSFYIKERFKQAGLKISEREIDYILQKSHAHPYYTQLLCQKIYFRILSKGKNEISQDDIAEAYREAVITEKDFFEELWMDLMSKKYYARVVKELVLKEGPIYTVADFKGVNLARILKNLRDKGIIVKEDKKYSLKDHFFQDYIKIRLQGKMF